MAYAIQAKNISIIFLSYKKFYFSYAYNFFFDKILEMVPKYLLTAVGLLFNRQSLHSLQ